MPTYTYKCTSNHVYEEQRGIKDVEVLPKICVECGKIMKRLYFEPVIALKGKGFYRNGG
jgi:putative FmdB family regulatory protein